MTPTLNTGYTYIIINDKSKLLGEKVEIRLLTQWTALLTHDMKRSGVT